MADGSSSTRAHTLFQQTLLGDAAEHAEVGVLVWNEERRYVAVNTAACRMIGATRAELLAGQVGAQNSTDAGRSALATALDGQPASGRTPLPTGIEVEWITVATDIAGLPHILGLMWPVREAPSS